MSPNTRLGRAAGRYDNVDTSAELDAAVPVEPPAPPAERITTFAVRLPVAVLDRVREIAEERRITTSALIRRWVDAGIADEGGDPAERVVPVESLLELISRAPRQHNKG